MEDGLYVIGWCTGGPGWVLGSPGSHICGRACCKVLGKNATLVRRPLLKGKGGKAALEAAGLTPLPKKLSGASFEFVWAHFKCNSSGKPVPL